MHAHTRVYSTCVHAAWCVLRRDAIDAFERLMHVYAMRSREEDFMMTNKTHGNSWGSHRTRMAKPARRV